MKKKISFAAVGDSLIVSRISKTDTDMLALRTILSENDIVLTNLEGSLHEYEPTIYPSPVSGGDWVTLPPQTLEDLSWLGFNLYSLPNNHSFDWMCGGILKTMENLKKHQAIYAGIGSNLSEACAPTYYSTPGGRVALIAFTTSFEPWQKAGAQRKDAVGRPGPFTVSHKTVHYITKEEMNTLKAISQKTSLPFHAHKDSACSFAGMEFQIGEAGTKTYLDENDQALIKSCIAHASRQADIVLISCHTHEGNPKDPEKNTDFQEELAHFCIDCGAHAYIAHGPHLLRGIEWYKKAPIFYSLGNFFYQCELIERQPEEFYHKFRDFDSHATAADVFDYRIQSGGILGETNPKYFQSVIAKFQLSNQEVTEVKLIPVTLQFHAHRSTKGTPKPATPKESSAILTHMADLCAPYGTSLRLFPTYATTTPPEAP